MSLFWDRNKAIYGRREKSNLNRSKPLGLNSPSRPLPMEPSKVAVVVVEVESEPV